MTQAQFSQLRQSKSSLDNGRFLSFFIRSILKNMHLTLMQDSSLQSLSGGDYKPHDDIMYKSALEVIGLASENKADALITLLKRLPDVIDAEAGVIFLLDGKPCSSGVWGDGDRDFQTGRWDGVSPRPKRSIENAPPVSAKDWKQLQDDFDDRWSNRKPIEYPKEVDIPVAKTDEYDPTPYADIGDEYDSLSSLEEFEYNEPSQPEIRRDRTNK